MADFRSKAPHGRTVRPWVIVFGTRHEWWFFSHGPFVFFRSAPIRMLAEAIKHIMMHRAGGEPSWFVPFVSYCARPEALGVQLR
jgi:hypothetical protein